jgi:hypothetical protein
LASTVETAAAAIADTKLRYSTGAGPVNYVNVPPAWSPVIEDPGSITAGDLYYVDTIGYDGDVVATLYISNADALSKDYAYLNMQVNVWELTHTMPADTWSSAQATYADGTAIGTVYLTLENGFITFVLEGNSHYAISIDGGNFYCVDTDAADGELSPDFYLEVTPL